MKRELQSAIESIQRGEFAKVEKILLQILAREPQNFDANHMLGIVSTELNKFEQADKFSKIRFLSTQKILLCTKTTDFF